MENITEQEKFLNLSQRIDSFLLNYACIKPDWDPKYDDVEDKYTSPDASMMKYCSEQLKNGIKPTRCFSEWSSGGYKPYTSVEGMELHNQLVKEVYQIINNK